MTPLFSPYVSGLWSTQSPYNGLADDNPPLAPGFRICLGPRSEL